MFKRKNSSNNKLDENKKYSPIVFVNNPVSDSEHDVIGFETQVETIQQAIDGGATMIGVIADYGTGKSSMTKLLCNAFESKGNPKPIRINMWDSLTAKSEPNNKFDVSDLTKSFLFQLANGKNSNLSRYINKILNKNYGNLSFAASKPSHFVIWAIVAGLLFLFYKMADISGTGVLKYLPMWVEYVVVFIRALSPCFLVASIAALLLGMKNLTVAYSHWKMTNKRDIEINDVFDTYKEIIERIIPKRGKQLIFIDDLDRINKKPTIIAFLKELYRFQESITDNADKIVFIVSVKPESELVDDNQAGSKGSDKEEKMPIYPKVFDATLFLKPIHFDDYDSILLRLITSNPEKKLALEELIGKEIEKTLPSSFRWIKHGTNLTLRDLKDRLNHAIAIMVSLKNKSYENNSAADFNACTAVAYLESQFPNDYYQLIKSEESFAEFIKSSYKIVDETKTEENIDELINLYKKCFDKQEYSQQFIKVLCGMVMEKTFKDDFRMYFYTYPQDSHIKTTEERELCNCLLYPNQYSIPSNLDDCVAQAYKNGKNDAIEKTLVGLDVFSSIVIENTTLFNHAVSVSMPFAIAVFKKHVIDEDTTKKDLPIYWNRIKGIEHPNKEQFIKLCIQKVAALSDSERIVKKRLDIIKGFGEEVIAFKMLFDGIADMPQITKEEIDSIADPNIYVQLICVKNIELIQQEYLCAALNSTQLINHETVWEKAVEVIKTLMQISDAKTIGTDLLKFLQNNRYIDVEMFRIVCSAGIAYEQIANYINMFDASELPKEYLEHLNKLGFSEYINEDIVYSMMEHTMFYTPILFYTKNNGLHQMDKFLGYREKIREACSKINDGDQETVITFRKHCLMVNVERLEDLFFGEYPLITPDEYSMFEQTTDAIQHINTAMIDEDNISALLHIIYSREYSPEELVDMFKYMFEADVNERYIDDGTVIKAIIDEIDFQRLGVKRLTYEQRSCLFATFSDTYLVEEAEDALDFLKKFGCLIPEVEQILANDKERSSDYCSLIAEADELSDITYNWVESNYLVAPLSEKLCESLLDKGWPTDYVVCNIMREKRLVMEARIEFSSYFEAYTNVDEVFNVMSNHWDFLQQLQEKADFEKLSEDHIVPIFKVPQTQRFFNYMLSEKTTADLKKQYLRQFSKFKTESDSVAFQKLICKPDNIKLVDSIDLKNSIYQRLWDTNRSHKGLFTKCWNREWASKLILKQSV